MIYVTSDLHGCSPETLQQLLDSAGFSGKDFLFVLGDVIDRGEYGAELLLWLTDQTNVQLILGNHESLMLACSFLFDEITEESLVTLESDNNPRMLQSWLKNGAAPTIIGLQKILHRDPELIQGILEYLREAPFYEDLTVNGRRFILVHGGLGNFHPDKGLEDYDPHDLIWERPSPDQRYFPDATVIFGHTPTVFFGEEYRHRALKTPDWICIDTGAAIGDTPMLLRLEDLKEFYLTP